MSKKYYICDNECNTEEGNGYIHVNCKKCPEYCFRNRNLRQADRLSRMGKIDKEHIVEFIKNNSKDITEILERMR